MRAFFLPLFAATVLVAALLPGRAAAQVEKEKEADAKAPAEAAPAKGEPAKKEDAEGGAKEAAPKKEPAWKVRRVELLPAGAQVMLEDKANRRLQNISKGDGPTRLLSVQHETEAGELRVKALIDGKEIEITQPLSDLEAGATRSSPAARGPGGEDRRKYEALNDAQREKFRDRLRTKFADPAFRNLPGEERRKTIRDIFEKIEKEAQEGR